MRMLWSLPAVTALLAGVLSLAGAAEGSGAAQAAAPKRSIVIVRAKSVRRLVGLKVRVRGWKLLPDEVGSRHNDPNGGHWRIYVDGHSAGFSARTSGFARMTRPGRHRIRVVLARNDGTLLQPRVRSRAVRVKVPSWGGPILAAAGDIACDPLNAAYNGGRGSRAYCRERATSNLLVNAGLTAVLALGDLQY